MKISSFFSIENMKSRIFLDPLMSSSLYIGLGRISELGFGFIFWLFAAKLYSVTDVGIASVLISILGLIILISRFGFDTTQIRFVNTYEKGKIFNSILWITAIISFFISVILLIFIKFISPTIAFLSDYAIFFILFSLFGSFVFTTGNTFISLRMAKYRFYQNLVLGLRILFLFVLVYLGSIGIFFSLGFAYFLAAIFGFILITKIIRIKPEIDRDFLSETSEFSSLNFLASSFYTVAILVLPIMILNLNGPEAAAIYFVTFSVSNLILIIPEAVGTSFFIEGSHGEDLRNNIRKSFVFIYILLIPAILLLFVLSGTILSLFGEAYALGISLLHLFIISTVFIPIITVIVPYFNVKMKANYVLVINLIRLILVLGLSYVFLLSFGLIGIGYAWLVAHFVLCIVVIVMIRYVKIYNDNEANNC